MNDILELISVFGFPVVVATILLIFFIKTYDSFNKSLLNQQKLLETISHRLDFIEGVILDGEEK